MEHMKISLADLGRVSRLNKVKNASDFAKKLSEKIKIIAVDSLGREIVFEGGKCLEKAWKE